MRSLSLNERFILTEGTKNSILIDFEDRKIFHISDFLKENLLSKRSDYIPKIFLHIVSVSSKFTEIIDENNIAINRKFDKLWVDISSICNLHCQGCYARNYMPVISENFLPEELTHKVVSLGKHFQTLDILGGEPFLNPKLKNSIKLFSASFDHIAIYTNGTIQNDEILSYCQDNNKISIKVSLYGIDCTDHDAYTGRIGSFGKTIQFIKTYKAKNIKLKLTYLLTDISKNKDQKKIEDFLKSQGVAYSVDIERHNGSIIKKKLHPKHPFQNFFKFKNYEQYISNLFRHTCINNKLGIDTDGNIYYCPMERTKQIGNILHMNTEDAIDSVRLHWAKCMSSKYNDCAVCEFRGLCFDCFRLDPIEANHPSNCKYNPHTGLARSHRSDI